MASVRRLAGQGGARGSGDGIKRRRWFERFVWKVGDLRVVEPGEEGYKDTAPPRKTRPRPATRGDPGLEDRKRPPRG